LCQLRHLITHESLNGIVVIPIFIYIFGYLGGIYVFNL